MAKLYAGINTERDTQVTRIGHRRLSTFVQTNMQRIVVDASPESFLISVDKGRYENAAGISGILAEVKEGYIFMHESLKDKIIFRA